MDGLNAEHGRRVHLRKAIEETEMHRAARLHAHEALNARNQAIVIAVRAGAGLSEIAEAASITRAAASLAARQTLAARPGRGGPYSRRRGAAHALGRVSEAARNLDEARERSRQLTDRRDKAIAAAVANGSGVSETARAVGMTPASISVIARSGIHAEAAASNLGAVASQ